jgi:glyoxylase-like metal-dependent hydrolase (beta-lactamase superfamily II)
MRTPEPLQIGQIKITILTDGVVYVDAGGPFGLVPRALYKDYLMPNAENQIPMVLTCLLVQTGGKNIIVDTGLGSKLTDKIKENWGLLRAHGDLLAQLAARNLAPADIDVVINTHLHGDHAAGNTCFNADFSGVQATFPNAHYYVQKREYQDATHTNERTRGTYYAMNFTPLVERGQMTLLEGEAEIVRGVFAVPTPGHTPGHQSVRFASEGAHGLFLADLASYGIHFEKLSWMTAYDTEPLITLETKRKWQAWALQTQALILVQHDPNMRAGYLRSDQGRLWLEKVR